MGPKASEVQPDNYAPVGQLLSLERVAHRPQRHKGVEVLGGDFEPTRTPLAERLADREEVVARGRQLIVVPTPVGLGRRRDDSEPFELLEPL